MGVGVTPAKFTSAVPDPPLTLLSAETVTVAVFVRVAASGRSAEYVQIRTAPGPSSYGKLTPHSTVAAIAGETTSATLAMVALAVCAGL